MFLKRKKRIIENPLRDRAAKGIAGLFIKVQIKFADVMNQRVSNMPVKRMKILLFVFCGFGGGLSIYFIVSAILSKAKTTMNIEHVKIPRHISEPEEQSVQSHVDFTTYQQIQRYKIYMDSTHQAIRPGLLDSMNVLEQIYLSQQQKSDENEK